MRGFSLKTAMVRDLVRGAAISVLGEGSILLREKDIDSNGLDRPYMILTVQQQCQHSAKIISHEYLNMPSTEHPSSLRWLTVNTRSVLGLLSEGSF